MKCPVCATEMDEHVRHGVTIDHCRACGGVWLGKGELDRLVAAVSPELSLPDPEPKLGPGGAAKVQHVERGAERRSDDRSEERRRERRAKPGRAHRYGRKYSARSRLKDVLEEIFDFD